MSLLLYSLLVTEIYTDTAMHFQSTNTVFQHIEQKMYCKCKTKIILSIISEYIISKLEIILNFTAN
jgi:hypothetical protein